MNSEPCIIVAACSQLECIQRASRLLSASAWQGCAHFFNSRSLKTIWWYSPSHAYNATTKHVEFSPTG